MTGDSPVLDRPALRAALSDMPIPPPEAETSFEAALARRQGWSLGFAERVAFEYRRFLYLAATTDGELTPSKIVDEVWHLHLTFGRHYRQVLCDRILGRTFEHLPGTGDPEEEPRFRRQYEKTLRLYEQAFGQPPREFWPRPGTPASLPPQDDPEEPWWRRSHLKPVGVFAAVGFAFSLMAGSPALAAGIVIGTGLLAGIPFLHRPERRKANGGCGGSCGSTYFGWSDSCSDGGGSSGGDGCGASCGGSCGGGCGGS